MNTDSIFEARHSASMHQYTSTHKQQNHQDASELLVHTRTDLAGRIFFSSKEMNYSVLCVCI